MTRLELLCVLLLLNVTAVSSRPQSYSSIVGGHDAKEGVWFWIAALVLKQSPHEIYCSGSILNERWVLTAAHCLARQNPQDDFTVRLGAYRLSKESPHETSYSIIQAVPHPKYKCITEGDDIAVLQLDRDITFSKFVGPVPGLAEAGEIFNSQSICYSAGWGQTAYRVPLREPRTLQQVQLSIVTRDTCSQRHNGVHIRPEMICAGTHETGVCKGDSGGPLMCYVSTSLVQVGVVSSGENCKGPDVFTRVSSYRDFIQKYTNRTSVELH
ncbi:tryptase-2-like [Megalops cyprinoides]|uniref:tryptase-2-like n=1 Tax=Megalops cyprinoides TaxID=118141 RepID=UPI001865165B|nr:tryptase-2-like [Megalops cyprinoides]